MVDFKHGLTRPVYYSIYRNLGLYSNYRVKSIGWHATKTTTGSPTEIIVDTSKCHTSLCPRGYRDERLTTSPSSGIEDSGRCSASPACGSNLRSKFCTKHGNNCAKPPDRCRNTSWTLIYIV